MFNNPIEQFNLINFFYFTNFFYFFIFVSLVFSNIFILYIKNHFNYKNLKIKKYVNFFTIYILKDIKFYTIKFNFIPSTNMQIFIEKYIYLFIKLFNKTLNWKKKNYFFFYLFFCFILLIFNANIIGLIPYSFVLTSQLFFNIYISFFIFFFIHFFFFELKKNNIFLIILPKGLNIYLNLLLIPIEIISYIFKPISLAIRLFANIMAGHILLKVICFFFLQMSSINFIFLLPFFLIFILYFLEVFVALLQTYVFFILICIFIKDLKNIENNSIYFKKNRYESEFDMILSDYYFLFLKNWVIDYNIITILKNDKNF